jgi:hypothetical protein
VTDREPPAFADRYPSIGNMPHRWRSRRANAIAALALIAALLLVVALLAAF